MFFCLYSIFETSFCLGPYSLIDKISDYNVESCPSWDVVPKKKKKFSWFIGSPYIEFKIDRDVQTHMPSRIVASIWNLLPSFFSQIVLLSR